MSFIFYDASNGAIIDIVEDRRILSLRRYFCHYSKEARTGVKHIVIDMYKSYIVLIKEFFLNVKIVRDKFPIVELISRSLNKTRVPSWINKEIYLCEEAIVNNLLLFHPELAHTYELYQIY